MAHPQYSDEQLKEVLNQLYTPEVDLREGVFSRLSGATPYRRTRRPWAVACYTILLLILTSGTVWALTSSTFQDLIQRINPSFGPLLEATELSSEDQGFRMELVGLATYDNMTLAYISLEDVSGQNRVDDRTTFYDFFSVTSNGGMSMSMSMADFNEETGVIVYELMLTYNNEEAINQPLTFRGSSIQWGEQSWRDQPIVSDLSDLQEAVATIYLPSSAIYGGGTGGDTFRFDSLEEQGGTEILEPQAGFLPVPEVDVFEITGIGLIDGELHVQVLRDLDVPGHVNISLRDLTGQPLEEGLHRSEDVLMIDFNLDEDGLPLERYDTPAYEEFIFRPDLERLADYQLVFSASEYQVTEGEWQITIDIAASEEPLVLDYQQTIGAYQIEQLRVSPFGVTIEGSLPAMEDTRNIFDESSLNTLEVRLHNGTKQQLTCSHQHNSFHHDDGTGRFSMFYLSDTPLDLADIEVILLTGTAIPVR